MKPTRDFECFSTIGVEITEFTKDLRALCPDVIITHGIGSRTLESGPIKFSYSGSTMSPVRSYKVERTVISFEYPMSYSFTEKTLFYKYILRAVTDFIKENSVWTLRVVDVWGTRGPVIVSPGPEPTEEKMTGYIELSWTA